MKLGCCLNMLGDEREPIGMKYMPALKKAGYDYMELPLAQIMDLSDADYERLRREVEKTGIPCECCNNFFPATVRLTGETADPIQIGDYARKAIERARKLGAKIIVFGSSGAKNIPEGFDRHRAFCQIVNTLKIADAYALPAGIHIVIEPLNRMESNVILNLSEGDFLMKEAGRPSIRLLVDYYHFTMEKESLDTLRDRMANIDHVHFAEPVGRRFPTKHKAEYEEFFQVLKNGRYDGRVSVEAYSDEPEQDIENAVFLRDYL